MGISTAWEIKGERIECCPASESYPRWGKQTTDELLTAKEVAMRVDFGRANYIAIVMVDLNEALKV